MLEYKLVNFRQKGFFTGRSMKVENLEKKINEFAQQGWTLDRIIAADVAGALGFGSKDVFIVVFNRETCLTESSVSNRQVRK